MKRPYDKLTVVGLALLAYVLSTLAHEGLGHGGACLALGGHLTDWGAYYVDCDQISKFPGRLVAAAGSTVNLIIALFAGLGLKIRLQRPGGAQGAGTLFLWIMLCINSFTWAGYFLFSGLAGIGDWQDVISGLPYESALRVGMALFGGLAYFLLGRNAGRYLGKILGGQDMPSGRIVSWTVYVTGGAMALAIGLMNPMGFVILLTSAIASSLGGTSGLLWLHQFMQPSAETGFVVKRNPVVIALGFLAAILFALVWGPTLRFGSH